MDANVRPLHEILVTITSLRGLSLAYDTHHDAGNLVIAWWQGRSRHRLDFQPLRGEPLQVTHLLDTYPFMPRLLHWCRRYIPMVPVSSKEQWQVLGTLSEPYSEESVEELIVGVLPPNNSSKPKPLRGSA